MYNRVTKNEKVHVKDSLGNITNQLKDTIVYKYEYQQVANPRIKDLERLDEKLQNLSIQIQNYESEQGGKRQKLEKEILLKSGFLHELKIMFHEILFKDNKFFNVASCFWFAILLFMVLLELLVLFATSGPPCDYEEIVLKQKEIYTSLIS